MKQTVRKWLEDGTVDVFIGYKTVDGHPLPHCFCRENLGELEDMVAGTARYPLEKIATRMAARDPGLTIGILARDCNQRALNVLAIWNQIDPQKIKPLSVNCCPSGLKAHADCSYLTPGEAEPMGKPAGYAKHASIEAVERYDQRERLDRWMYEFQKCIKCYGCRNICPVCFCRECSLENPDLVQSGRLPPEVPIFHLVRAVHMAGRCIDCGLCEDVCPAEIPLRLLYRKVNDIVMDVFGYETGTSAEPSPFSVLGDNPRLEPKPLSAA